MKVKTKSKIKIGTQVECRIDIIRVHNKVTSVTTNEIQ